MDPTNCPSSHDWTTNLITGIVIVGLVISYAPQHHRIIASRTSEGLNPLFLLLGSTSSAAGMWNMVTMQWGVEKCCSVIGFARCLELTAGIFQVFIQWFCFTMVFVLYIKFYPSRMKYIDPNVEAYSQRNLCNVKTSVHSSEWRFSLFCAWLTFAHFLFCGATTLCLLPITGSQSSPPTELPSVMQSWGTVLGVTSAILAAIQYTPQLIHTYQKRLVGALSIPMMCMQSPGAVLMILGIALRPGTNWTSWFPFLVAGIMQGSLLVLCILWKMRQHRLGIDDFGDGVAPEVQSGEIVHEEEGMDERTALLRS